MDEFELSAGGQAWRTERGSVSIWKPGRGFLIVRGQGHGAEKFAGPCTKALDAVLAHHRPARIFADFGEAQSYDSQFRIKLTEGIARKRHDVKSVDVFVRSRLVAMGIAVANLTLEGLIRSFAERHDFNAALDAALTEAGIVKFSSHALVARDAVWAQVK